MDSIKKIYRSKTDKKISGVCGGLAVYLGVDVTVIRILWALAAIFMFPLGVLMYIVCVFIIPMEPSDFEAYFEEKE